MMRVLTDKEAKDSERRVNEFLLSLDLNIKYNLALLLEPLINKMNCEHDWIDLDSYSNEFPKGCEMCRKCNLIKKKS